MRWPFSGKSKYQQELDAVKAITAAPVQAAPEATVMPTLVVLDEQRQIAPPPTIDKYPLVLGANLTGQYISSCFRLANMGWRYQMVDLLDELIENDPDARAVVRARILGVACGRYAIEPARLGKLASDADRALAQILADEFALQFENIPHLTQRIQQLAWADWYGVGAHEIKWEHPSSSAWSIADLCHIHSRRINYTDPNTWEAHIYDQGLVTPTMGGMASPTNGIYGLPVSKYPGKFLLHTPALSGQYPTRDGEGRNVAFYLLLKRMITRASGQDFERVIRPWVLGYFNRKIEPNQTGPTAGKEDITALSAALGALGAGSLNSAALPNTVKVELLRAAAAMSATEFLQYLNQSLAKALLGQAFTTAPGANGNFATAEVADRNTTKILEYSSSALAATIRYGLALPWLQLNHPNVSRLFCPRVVADVSNLPAPKELIEIASKAAEHGVEVDASDIAARTSLKLVPQDDEVTPRMRYLKPGQDADASPDEQQPNQPEQRQPAKLVNLKPTGSGKPAMPEA